MTLSPAAIHKNIWFALLTAFCILAIGLFLMHKAAPLHQDAVAGGFLFDMVITFPVTWYFLVLRPLRLRKWSILLVITCCCTVAYLILPTHQRHYILQLRELIALPELAWLIYTLSKIRHIRAEYRRLEATLPDIAYNLHKSISIIMGDTTAIKIIASELTILRFGLFFWKKQQPIAASRRFSIHREIAYASLFGVIIFACAIELIAFHLFLNHYSHIAAIIITILSIYGILFLIGDFTAIIQNPVLILKNQILLRTGLRWRALVDVSNITSIQKVTDSFEAVHACFNGGLMKNRVNILFNFSEPLQIERLYRKNITTNQIVMTVDEADELIAALAV
ncbi:hypothetical protein HDF19_01960 [Mucilaginibacter sp. E4BP6]|uniref:hypothetical protein n=1 Tax=Mucilaginibacter sp. E4BP6 TaxID=2723089 RepID=UPI0015CD5C13|nr:hypothetical protein [Mucilaginibacter sp. E4BP6]NYE66644.1 hypothetical protein [Mucilaginibacter sp. E4BP6]